jgi:hypothetical protein
MHPSKWAIAFLIAASAGSSANAAPATPVAVDVVVYGATPAGVCAAVAARREGVSVAIVEPTDLVGGMMTSGLSFSDSNQMARECLLGLFDEFHQRLEAKYRVQGTRLEYSVAEKDQRPWTYEPHMAEAVFNDLLREVGLQVLLNCEIQAVVKDSARIKHIITRNGLQLVGRVFIDATYDGDLMALAKVGYRVGREGRDEYDESFAGKQFPKKTVSVSPFETDGGLLPLVTAAGDADPRKGDHRTMTYSFRLCLTDVPTNRVPITQPDNYDPTQFELFRRYYAKYPSAEFPIDLYSIPGGKFDANNGIAKQLSLGLVGASSEWPDATPEHREDILRQHRAYTQGLLWFLANDVAVPEHIRARATSLGLAKDEFQRYGNWPPVLYVRESRRMKGAYIMTQSDILTNTTKPDSIAVGSFPIDSHDCQRLASSEGGFTNEGAIFPRHIAGRAIGQPYRIPYRSIIPRSDECDNLLVPMCLSATHVAMCSIRVEPTWMVLGQSSGIAAALIAREDVAVGGLEYAKLKTALVARDVVLIPSGEDFR